MLAAERGVDVLPHRADPRGGDHQRAPALAREGSAKVGKALEIPRRVPAPPSAVAAPQHRLELVLGRGEDHHVGARDRRRSTRLGQLRRGERARRERKAELDQSRFEDAAGRPGPGEHEGVLEPAPDGDAAVTEGEVEAVKIGEDLRRRRRQDREPSDEGSVDALQERRPLIGETGLDRGRVQLAKAPRIEELRGHRGERTSLETRAGRVCRSAGCGLDERGGDPGEVFTPEAMRIWLAGAVLQPASRSSVAGW